MLGTVMRSQRGPDYHQEVHLSSETSAETCLGIHPSVWDLTNPGQRDKACPSLRDHLCRPNRTVLPPLIEEHQGYKNIFKKI